MADLKVVPFKACDNSVHDRVEVIRKLEECLAFVKEEGNERVVRAMAVVLLTDGPAGGLLSCWHNGKENHEMLGAIESLKVDFVHACIPL